MKKCEMGGCVPPVEPDRLVYYHRGRPEGCGLA